MRNPVVRRPRTFIIAEAGVNHNGSLKRALAMIRVAAKAGADAVKFQSFITEHEVTRAAPKAAYQKRNTGTGGSQFAMLKALEMSRPDQRKLMAACRAAGIEFMSTPFDPISAAFLAKAAAVKRLKVASGEITNGPLLLALARSGKPIVLSTGMSTMAEIKAALAIIAFGYTSSATARPSRPAFAAAFRSQPGQAALRRNVVILQCTSEYPAAFETINLKAMDRLAAVFGLRVGLSDHSPGITASVAAVARGAAVIEKHFTLDRRLPGPDHKASLTPDELSALVTSVRAVEAVLGGGGKSPTAGEVGVRKVARKSLVALRPIKTGEAFTAANLGAKRPGGGVSPLMYWDVLGRRATRAYRVDDLIAGRLSR